MAAKLINIYPCPFCGETEQLGIEATGSEADEYRYIVECKTCGSRTAGCETFYDALIAWNKRVPAEPIKEIPRAEPERSEPELAELSYPKQPDLVASGYKPLPDEFDLSKETTVGKRIKALRKRRCMSQSVLGQKIGVSAPKICSWEQGNSFPKAADLDKLARELRVDAAALREAE